jgi:hypothetical protein
VIVTVPGSLSVLFLANAGSTAPVAISIAKPVASPSELAVFLIIASAAGCAVKATLSPISYRLDAQQFN